MQRKQLAVLVLALCSTWFTYAQISYTPEELFSEGQYFLNREDYQEAAYFFKQLAGRYPENAHFNFLAGSVYINIAGQEHLAIPFLEIAVKSIVPRRKYTDSKYEETNAPLHALFYLGQAYRSAGRLQEALQMYNKFEDSPYFPNQYNQNVVDQEIKSCERALIIQSTPIACEKQQLDTIISSDFKEWNGVLSERDSVLVFMRSLKFYDAIFVSRKSDGKWSAPENINPQIGSDGDFTIADINADGTKILLVRSQNQNTDIYLSWYNGTMWQPAEKLEGRLNTAANESHACFGASENEIFFISDRMGGKGGLDIYAAELDGKEKWQNIRNIDELNTEFDEQTVFVCQGGKKLFFSSKGHYNMGGYDIFYSAKDQGSWKAPQNMGYPINSTRDDLFYFPLEMQLNGLYAMPDSTDFTVSDLFFVRIKGRE